MQGLLGRTLLSANRRFPRTYRVARYCYRKVRRPLLAAQGKLGRLIFERGGLDTRPTGSRDGLEEDHNRYEPSRWTYLPRALRGDRVQPDDVFVDLGCGMGRVVLQAARRPFRRVIGVEISAEKIAVARYNADHMASDLRCPDVELVTMDALRYEIPTDATHIYLFNPLVGDAFRQILANVVDSYDRRPRRMRVLYANPIEDEILQRSDRFVPLRVSHGLRRDRRIIVYEVTGPGATSRRN